MRKLLFSLAAVVAVLLVAGAVFILILSHRVKGLRLVSEGVRLHYTVEGEGDPVVLLHGFAVNSDLNWRLPGITEALAKDFRVISLDLRGHGLSDRPHDADQYGSAMVRDVLSLLDHLNIGQAHLVGYSLGGFITLKLAATHPRRLISASILAAGWEKPDNPEFLRSLDRLEENLRSGHAIGPLSGHLGHDRPKPGLLHTWFVKLMTGFFNDRQALAAMIETLPDLALSEEELRSVTVPLCVIVGSRDPLKASAEAMIGRAHDLEFFVVEGADHIRTTMRPETLDVLKSFLMQHSRKRTERKQR